MSNSLIYQYSPPPKPGKNGKRLKPSCVQLECQIVTLDNIGTLPQWLPKELHNYRESIQEDGLTKLSAYIESQDAKMWKVKLSCKNANGSLCKTWPASKTIDCMVYADGDQSNEEKMMEWSILPKSWENPIVVGEVPCRFYNLPTPSLRKPFMWRTRDQPTDGEEVDVPADIAIEELASIRIVLGHCKYKPSVITEADRETRTRFPEALQYGWQFKHSNLTHFVDLGDPESMPSGIVEGASELDGWVEDFTPFVEYTFYYASRASLVERGIHSSVLHNPPSNSSRSTRQERTQRVSAVNLIRSTGIINKATAEQRAPPPSSSTTATSLVSGQGMPWTSQGANVRSSGQATRQEIDTNALNTSGSALDATSRRYSLRIKPPLRPPPPPQALGPVASSSAARASPSSSRAVIHVASHQLTPLSMITEQRGTSQASIGLAETPISASSKRPRSSSKTSTQTVPGQSARSALTDDVKPVIDLSDGSDDGDTAPSPSSTLEEVIQYVYDGEPIDLAVYSVFEKGGIKKDWTIKKPKQALKRCGESAQFAWFAKLEAVMPDLFFGAVEKQLKV